MRNAQGHGGLIEGGLSLWRQILAFVPNPAKRGRALELGSPPFNITLLLQKFRNYDLSLTGYASDGRREISTALRNPDLDETYDFRCDCFDAESERFPYEDDSFDLVTWCEVIEHLTENPVFTLSEIHRVLKPGGALVLSTPNASRADSVANLLWGVNMYDPYHLGAALKGSRHSREYTFQELRDLIAGCGFEIERIEDIDIYPPDGLRRRLLRGVMNNVVRRLTGGHYRYHLFVRARKTAAPFRWYFPDRLFDPGHLVFYLKPRDARVVMGQNDAIHVTMGWHPLQAGTGGRASRRTGESADLYLMSTEQIGRVTARVCNGHGRIRLMHDNGGDFKMLGETTFDAPPGSWTDIAVPIASGFEPGNPLHVQFQNPDGVDVNEVWAE
jgi:SAM-dependent methyltransferase